MAGSGIVERAGCFAALRVRGAAVALTGRFRAAGFPDPLAFSARAFCFFAAGNFDPFDFLFPTFALALARGFVFDGEDGLGDLRDFIPRL